MGMIRQAYIEAPISMAILGLSLAVVIGLLILTRKELEDSVEQKAQRFVDGVIVAVIVAIFAAYKVLSALAS
jgi:hypothetical protein